MGRGPTGREKEAPRTGPRAARGRKTAWGRGPQGRVLQDGDHSPVGEAHCQARWVGVHDVTPPHAWGGRWDGDQSMLSHTENPP